MFAFPVLFKTIAAASAGGTQSELKLIAGKTVHSLSKRHLGSIDLWIAFKKARATFRSSVKQARQSSGLSSLLT